MKRFVFSTIKLFFWFVIMHLSACRITSTGGKKIHPSLRLLHQYTIPFDFVFDNTPVGGLSGIDYDSSGNIFYLICDDRSDIQPARFYTARIDIRENRVDTIIFLSTKPLLRPDGKPYPSAAKDQRYGTDPESIRYHPASGQLYWSSEGERLINENMRALINPYIHAMDKEGRFLDSLEMPSILNMQDNLKGPRRNGTLESICFDAEFHFLYAGMEEPLYEDGPRAATADSSAWVRLIAFDLKTKKAVAQYGYRIDPVKNVPVPAGAYKVNGISEMLNLDKNRLIIMERSYSVGRTNSNIRLYIADFSKANNISMEKSLYRSKFKAVTKTLLMDLDTLGIDVDNMEGICWGPILANGKRSLVMVSDNNFSRDQKTQFFLFEYNGE